MEIALAKAEKALTAGTQVPQLARAKAQFSVMTTGPVNSSEG
jgi:hypothetical protein